MGQAQPAGPAKTVSDQLTNIKSFSSISSTTGQSHTQLSSTHVPHHSEHCWQWQRQQNPPHQSHYGPTTPSPRHHLPYLNMQQQNHSSSIQNSPRRLGCQEALLPNRTLRQQEPEGQHRRHHHHRRRSKRSAATDG